MVISLAHFCEVHGPTSILCTQVLPISCLTCFPPDAGATGVDITTTSGTGTGIGTPNQSTSSTSRQNDATSPPASAESLEKLDSPKRANSEPHSRTPSFSRRSHGAPAAQRSSLLDQHLQTRLAHGDDSTYPAVPIDPPSPLESPRSPGSYQLTCYSASLGSSGAAARYGGAGAGAGSTSSTDTCLNCSLSIPKSVSERLPDGAPGSPTGDGRGRNGSPVLRTREAFLAPGNGNVSVDLSRLDEKHASEWTRSAKKTHRAYRDAAAAHPTPSTSVGEDEDEDDGIPPSSSLSSSSASSSSSSSSSMHTPDVSRTSTFATSFPTTPPSTPPTHAHTLTYLSTRQPSSLDAHSLLRRSCIRTLSCEQLPRTHTGPLFFGDDRSGYTISFVFRLQDSCARGRMRRYAFIAWAGRDERRAARAYKDILHVFAGMASRIVQMAERREAAACTAGGGGAGSSSSDASSILSRDSVPVSSFLSGRSVDPDGHPRRADVRAKGLAELAGKENIFVDMHAAFVHLLAQLGRNLGGWPMGTIVDSGIRGEVGEMSKSVGGRRRAVKANVADTATDPNGGDGHHRTSIMADVPSQTIAIPKRTSGGSAVPHNSSKTHNQAAAASSAHSSSPASKTPTGTKPTRPGLRTSRGKPSISTASVPSTNSSTGTNSSATTTATTVATGKTPSASSTSSSSGKGLTLDGRAPSPLESLSRRQIAV
ncbi:MAG: hypothetical protein M1815_000360 [Lichina confinis]|nr:MAG: hypothetical protein M1815_000360 [Lichina confinis]